MSHRILENRRETHAELGVEDARAPVLDRAPELRRRLPDDLREVRRLRVLRVVLRCSRPMPASGQ